MTITARWNGETLARSDDTVVVEGNHYFPAGDVARGILVPSETTSQNAMRTTLWLITTRTAPRQEAIAKNRNRAFIFAPPQSPDQRSSLNLNHWWTHH